MNVRHVTWDLLSTLGVQVQRGRDFTPDDDTWGATRTAIVNHAFWQRELGGTRDAIGKQISLDEAPVTVIGVLPRNFTVARVEDIFLPFGIFNDPHNPMYSGRGNHFGLAAIARLKPGVSKETARAEMMAVRRSLGAARWRIARQMLTESVLLAILGGAAGIIVDASIGNQRLTMVLLIGFAGLALLTAAVGVFGVTAYSVSQRTHELGIRMALGANRGSVLGLVVRQEMTACLSGIAIGIGGAALLSSLLESLLFGVQSRDAATLSTAAIVLLVSRSWRASFPRSARRASMRSPPSESNSGICNGPASGPLQNLQLAPRVRIAIPRKTA